MAAFLSVLPNQMFATSQQAVLLPASFQNSGQSTKNSPWQKNALHIGLVQNMNMKNNFSDVENIEFEFCMEGAEKYS